MLSDDAILPVRIEGAPRARGQAQGEALRPSVREGLRRWKDHLQTATKLRSDEYLATFLAGTQFLPAIELWTPHLLEEVRGIGEGAAVPFDEIYAYQLMDEEWLFRDDIMRAADSRALEHCSTVGVFGEGGTPLLAQNMDLPKYYDGTQTLLHIVHDTGGLESLVFTPAGLIGTTGLNNRGIGICCNTLLQLAHARKGLPVAFVTRRLLESTCLEAAVEFVRTIEHASGQNYAIGGPSRILDFECSAHEVAQFTPHPTRLYHTNHPLANRDQPIRPRSVPVGAFGKGSSDEAPSGQSVLSNSELRFAQLERSFGARTALPTVEAAKDVLTLAPINVPRAGMGNGMTLGSLVMELSRSPVLHFAPGPPAESVYTRYTF